MGLGSTKKPCQIVQKAVFFFFNSYFFWLDIMKPAGQDFNSCIFFIYLSSKKFIYYLFIIIICFQIWKEAKKTTAEEFVLSKNTNNKKS